MNFRILKQRREREDLKKDLIPWDKRNSRGRGRKIKKDACRRDIKNSFPQSGNRSGPCKDYSLIQSQIR